MSAKHPVRIERQHDGRHAVVNHHGHVLGVHKSVWSASRQMHEYYNQSPPTSVPAPKAPKQKALPPRSGPPLD